MSCKFNDCGWCYHPFGPENGCPGEDKCPVISDINVNNDNEEGRPAESDEEHPQADAQAD